MQNLKTAKAHVKQTANDSWHSLRYLIKWLLIGGLIGLVVGIIGSVFGHTLAFVNRFRSEHPWILCGLPIGGLLIVFLYRFFRNTSDKGTNTVIQAVRGETEIPGKTAPLIFISTVVTHLFGGSAGREGAALQLGGSIADQFGRMMKFSGTQRRILVMCGMSAGFSALFGTPMAAAIFVVEVACVGVMQYPALMPSVTASVVAGFVADWFKMPPEVFPVLEIPEMGPLNFLKIVVLASAVGGLSILFCMLLHQAEHLYQKYLKNPYLRIAAAGCLVILLTLVLRTDLYLGSGMGIIEHIFHEGETRPLAFLLKMIFTAVTLGAGFKGGEIVPSFTIGAAFGCVAAGILGLPVELAAACGMVGLFCGVTNCPLASLVISFELFGFEGMPYYLSTIAVSYLLSGRYSLYHSQEFLQAKIVMDDL